MGGIASSAGVVTSAAVIMMAVFSIFATLALIQFKMLGVTLTAAVLIDATVVRGILLPAAWPCSASAAGTCRAALAGCPAGPSSPSAGRAHRDCSRPGASRARPPAGLTLEGTHFGAMTHLRYHVVKP